jgi:hypothetical protein
MAVDTTTTEVATIPPGGFPALNHSVEEIQAIIADNLAGQDINEFDLRRLRVPAGGATRWEIPRLGGTTVADEIEGILVHHKQTRAYWPGAYEGGSEPPQCASADGRVGVGDPGGDCKTCPLAQFGTAIRPDGTDARGQACKQMSQWFLLTGSSFLPVVATLPPMSLKGARQYLLDLAGEGIRFYEVVTALALTADKSQDGIRFSKAVPRLVGRVDPDTAVRARSYADLLRSTFDHVVPTAEDRG